MTEDQLIERLNLKSRAAYEHAYFTYRDVVFRTICKYIEVMEDAEEIVQDVFVKAFKKIDQFNRHSQLGTWLVKIAINASKNFLLSIEKQKQIIVKSLDDSNLTEEDNLEISSELPTPEELLLKKEDRVILLKGLSKLTADQHTACNLFYLEGFAQLDIAEIMGMSLDAVQSLIQRGRAKLRSILYKTQLNLSL
jgi:RNA polymerase sigma-70 factor (ECF subfamily)